jgi:hypothetical protein
MGKPCWSLDLAVRCLIPIAAFLLPAADPLGGGAPQPRPGGGLAAGGAWGALWHQCCHAGSGSGIQHPAAAAAARGCAGLLGLQRWVGLQHLLDRIQH